VLNIKETGKTTLSKERELKLGQRAPNMMDSMKMERSKDPVLTTGLMEAFTQETGSTIKSTGSAGMIGKMAVSILDAGKTMTCMESVSTSTQTV
jgi:hypothetical protein